MQDDFDPPVSARSLDDTLDQLFVAAHNQVPASPTLVQSVVDRAQQRLRRRRRVLLSAVLLGGLCCLWFLAPAISALGAVMGSWSQPFLQQMLQPALVNVLQSPYGLGAIAGGLGWLAVLSTEPG